MEAVIPRATALLVQAHADDPDVWSTDAGVKRLWREHYLSIFRELRADGAIEECADALYDYYNQPGLWKLYPDVLPTLANLHERGYKIGVISDWASNLSADILLPLGVGPYITFMVVSTNLREAKPGAGLYREALARAGVPAQVALMVGDNYVKDVLGARSAGISGVLLDRDEQFNHPLDCPRITSLLELRSLLPGRE